MTSFQARKAWVLSFDGLPANDNARRSMHFMTRAKHDREWHDRVLLQVLEVHMPRRIDDAGGLTKIRVSAVFYHPRLGVADPDNDRARLKPVIDGLVHAGVIRRDTYDHVDLNGPCTEERGPSGFRLIVEDLSREADA